MKDFNPLRQASLLAAAIAVLALAGPPGALAEPPDPPDMGGAPAKKGEADGGIDLSNGQNDLFAHTGQESSPPDGTDAHLPPCRADVTADRVVDADDLMEVILQWGESPAGTLSADADGDGIVGVGDLIEVITNWGLCP
jgi:hypothetical protein